MPKWIGNAAVGLVCTARRHGTPPLQRHAAVPVFVGDGQRRRELVLYGEPVRASDSTCYTIYRMCRGYVPCACACVCVPGPLGPDSARLRERSLLSGLEQTRRAQRAFLYVSLEADVTQEYGFVSGLWLLRLGVTSRREEESWRAHQTVDRTSRPHSLPGS